MSSCVSDVFVFCLFTKYGKIYVSQEDIDMMH